MPAPPRPKRFQIHLSTAIVMMFVAGALIWANTIPITTNHGPDCHNADIIFIDKGWPFIIYEESYFFALEPFFLQSDGRIFSSPGNGRWAGPATNYWAIPSNIAVGGMILIIFWYFNERLIRRRAARKAP